MQHWVQWLVPRLPLAMGRKATAGSAASLASGNSEMLFSQVAERVSDGTCFFLSLTNDSRARASIPGCPRLSKEKIIIIIIIIITKLKLGCFAEPDSLLEKQVSDMLLLNT